MLGAEIKGAGTPCAFCFVEFRCLLYDSSMDVVVVNENDEIIGTMPVEVAHKDGTPHRIAVVYVENPAGEFLVQVRADGFLDHSAAGHVDPGESYEEAAGRELSEELGISGVPLQRIGHARTTNERYPGKISSHVFDIFLCVAEPGELQIEEVSGVYWAQPDAVLKEMGEKSEKFCGGFQASLPVYIEHKKSV